MPVYHTKEEDRKNVSFHYDLSNDFYRLFLDQNLVYSCGYFQGDVGLDQAQEDKLDYLCRKLRLQPGEKLLDIGCGWGGLIRWAAKHYGVEAYGVTISRNQYEYAKEQIDRDGVSRRCTVELRDYRDVEGTYDKIVSVGMFEHVGLGNLRGYFRKAVHLLAEKGLFLNHGIAVEERSKGKSPEFEFIRRHIFPGGELPTMPHALLCSEREGFEILDVESLRPHYARTLRFWAKRLEARKEEAIRQVGEEKYRTWLLYLAGCAHGFERGGISVFQVLLSKRKEPGPSRIPATREDIYRS